MPKNNIPVSPFYFHGVSSVQKPSSFPFCLKSHRALTNRTNPLSIMSEFLLLHLKFCFAMAAEAFQVFLLFIVIEYISAPIHCLFFCPIQKCISWRLCSSKDLVRLRIHPSSSFFLFVFPDLFLSFIYDLKPTHLTSPTPEKSSYHFFFISCTNCCIPAKSIDLKHKFHRLFCPAAICDILRYKCIWGMEYTINR